MAGVARLLGLAEPAVDQSRRSRQQMRGRGALPARWARTGVESVAGFRGAVLFHLNMGLSDHFRPLVALGFDEGGKLFGRTGHRLEHLRIEEARAKSRIVEDFDHF